MVDQVLLERALQLGESARRELMDALQDSLDDGEVAPAVAALVDQRLDEADANTDDFVKLDEFEARVRSRRTA